MNNITPRIRSAIGKNLHNQKHHPIWMIKNRIYNYLGKEWRTFDNLQPLVSVEENFDSLMIPARHPARRESDTFYENDSMVLRTHTSAHQAFFLQQKMNQFLVTGDVYRKDHIDYCHYPVFHQMEGVMMNSDAIHEILDGLMNDLFRGHRWRRVVSSYAYAEPAWEYEVKWGDKWVEVIGCGVINEQILANCERPGEKGWSFGIGLERAAMIAYGIKDIRWFWSDNKFFLGEFMKASPRWVPLGEQNCECYDIKFTIPVSGENFQHNNFCMYVWEKASPYIEEIKMIGLDQNLVSGSRHYRLKLSKVGDIITTPEAYDVFWNNIIPGIENDLPIKVAV